MNTFYFYDLETSGISAKTARVMQFAGQRTDMDLKPIGDPHNILIKMTPDTLPDPQAIMVTGITPQSTALDGLTEAEFLKLFYDEIALTDTIFTGFNTVRFDDEFMRYMHYRNFYDPYEWQWSDGRSRWDVLDMTRMLRALRPDSIQWPVDAEGRPTNKLELLTSLNKLEHSNAHDALSDVYATIEWTRLIRQKQPKLFKHLLDYRGKRQVAELVESGQPFVYSSGRFSNDFQKTAVCAFLTEHSSSSAVVVDLRYDPTDLTSLSVDEIVSRWQHWCKERPCPHPRVPLKVMKYNRCPAVAPLGVVDSASQKRLQLDLQIIQKHHKALYSMRTEILPKIKQAIEKMDTALQQSMTVDNAEVDAKLYDGFIEHADKAKASQVRQADKHTITQLDLDFRDDRYTQLLPLYKARNFPKYIDDQTRAIWDAFVKNKLMQGGESSEMATYFKKLHELSQDKGLSDEKRFLLEELQLWGQSIFPAEY